MSRQRKLKGKKPRYVSSSLVNSEVEIRNLWKSENFRLKLAAIRLCLQTKRSFQEAADFLGTTVRVIEDAYEMHTFLSTYPEVLHFSDRELLAEFARYRDNPRMYAIFR